MAVGAVTLRGCLAPMLDIQRPHVKQMVRSALSSETGERPSIARARSSALGAYSRAVLLQALMLASQRRGAHARQPGRHVDVARRWAWLAPVGLALLLVLAACGDSKAKSTATATGSNSGGATQVTSSATPAPAEATATEAGAASGGDMPRGKIVVTGAVSQSFTADAECGSGALGDDLQVLSSSVGDGDLLWFLQIYVNNFVAEGAQDYAIGAVNQFLRCLGEHRCGWPVVEHHG